MVSSASRAWRALACDIKELRLDITLACGQSFRWRELSPGEWTSVLCGRIWTLKQNTDTLFYKVIEPEDSNFPKDPPSQGRPKIQDAAKKNKVRIKEETSTNDTIYEDILKDYFQLKFSLVDLYQQWADADPNFRQVASTFGGVRMLRQDPTENVFSFICSSNNHISRISSMVERMCSAYGQPVGEMDGHTYHAFPTAASLAQDRVELRLRELGFGYRAKFINQSARIICERGDEWLYSLRGVPYEEAKAELMTLCGIGPKVADCVCLMSLDQLGAIPVDTHVWQIAARHYIPSLTSAKSLTPTIYRQIGDHFRSLWGDLAGWAHSVLFSADLKKFQDLKSNDTKTKTKIAKKQSSKNHKKMAEEKLETNPDTKPESALSSPRKRPQKAKKVTHAKRTKR